MKKSCTDEITKSVRAVGRVGIPYNNRKIVQEKRADGRLPATPQPIWKGKGVWVEFPYILKHKDSGQEYLRLTPSADPRHTPRVQYYRNGSPVDLEAIEDVLLASEKRHAVGDCFSCKVEDMVQIHWELDDVVEPSKVPIEDGKPEPVGV